MTFRDGVLVESQPGAMPPAMLEDLINQVKSLDMDQVRAKIAARKAAPRPKLNPSSEESVCHTARCPDCGKTGLAGCGQHADVVMQTVPVAQKCSCRFILVNAERDHAELRGDPGTRSH